MNSNASDVDPASGPFYVLIDGTEDEIGPFTASELQGMIGRGEVPPSALCAKPGDGDWKPISAVPSLGLAASQTNISLSPRGHIVAFILLALLFVVIARPFREATPAGPEAALVPPNREYFGTVILPETRFERLYQGRNLHKVAYRAATNLVAEQLVSPRSAIFSTFGECEIEGFRYRFRVTGFVDAQNRLGVPIRHRFDIRMKRTEDEYWSIHALELDE